MERGSERVEVRMRLWQASVGGAVFGLIFGMVLEVLRQLRSNAASRRMVEEFESLGMSPPLMTDVLKPYAIPLAASMLFTVVGSLIFFIRSRNEDN